MRVALSTYSTRARGGVVHTLSLAEALVGLGVEVCVYALGRGGDDGFFRPVDPGVDVRVVPCPDVDGETVGERVVRSIELLAASIDPHGFDVVHAQDCISANAVHGAIRTVHHLDQFSTRQLAACHERAIVSPPHHICVSAAVAAELRAGWGIEATVIPNGVDADRFERAAGPEGTEARAAWRDRIGGPYVVAVGGIEPRKGTLDLIDAMALLRSGRPDITLVIAGGETLFDYRSYRGEFDRRCAELELEPLLLGPVEHDVLPTLVAGAEAFAFPSVKEGFGLAAMEALAAGVPVVARDLPVLREVYGDSIDYFTGVPDLARGLQRALSSHDPTRVDAGRRVAAGYRWEDAARAHVSLYRRVVRGRSAQPSAG